jgi:hypothetical protein
MGLCHFYLKETMKKVMQLTFKEEPPYDEIIEKIWQKIQREIRIGQKY